MTTSLPSTNTDKSGAEKSAANPSKDNEDSSKVKPWHNTKKYIFTAEELAAIELVCDSTTEKYALRRLEVLRLRAKGESDDRIAQATGYSKTSIRRLVWEYQAYGLETMASMPPTGKRQYTANNYELTDAQIAELKDAYDSVSSTHVKEKINALLLRAEGNTVKAVAKETGFINGSISAWMHRYKQGGITALGDKRYRKKPFIAYKHHFTEEQKAEIEAAHANAKNLTPRAAARLEVLWLRACLKSFDKRGEKTDNKGKTGRS